MQMPSLDAKVGKQVEGEGVSYCEGLACLMTEAIGTVSLWAVGSHG